MAELRPESRQAARQIRAAYAETARRRTFRDRAALERARAAGRLAPLPPTAAAFNLAPRLTGRHPIGEKDLRHQDSYLAAHPGTLGCLLALAARVPSAPLDITSLVRHRRYQRALGRTNANARTSVPTHAIGLAFDVSVLHASPEVAIEIRDALRAMRDAGDLFFVAERYQLVFHVVPTPGRLAYHAALFQSLTRLGGTTPVPAEAVMFPTALTPDLVAGLMATLERRLVEDSTEPAPGERSAQRYLGSGGVAVAGLFILPALVTLIRRRVRANGRRSV